MSEDFVTFSSKKSAKQHAAKKAFNWLISHEDLMPPGGAISSEASRLQQLPQPTTPPVGRPQSPPYTARVPDLCHRLDFPPPAYILEPAVKIPNCAVWDGYADFAGHPRIGDEGKVGRVENIHGKKNAKEAIARQVYTFLKGIETDRLGLYEEEDKKRKRYSSGSQN